jgi:hypothetical protein
MAFEKRVAPKHWLVGQLDTLDMYRNQARRVKKRLRALA